MAILLDKAFVNLIANMLEDGEWQKAIRTMVDNGLTEQNVYDLTDRINFYPNTNFDKYLSTMSASRKAKETLDGFFAKNI